MKKYKPLCLKKRKVILDTDIGPDCDDVGSIALLCRWADEYGYEIAGIVNCTSNRYGTACIDAICTYLGKPDILIGEYKPEGFNANGLKYNKYIAENYPNKYINGERVALDATELYERVISESEDDGVIIITVGMLNTFWFAYEKNKDLFNKKIHAVIPMAAEYKKGHTYNIYCHTEAAKRFCEEYDGEVFFSGYELGVDIITGFESVCEENPLSMSYSLYCGDPAFRKSWDLVTVMFAVFGENEYFGLTETGKVVISDNGDNVFEADEDGNHTFITANISKRDLEAIINEVLRR